MKRRRGQVLWETLLVLQVITFALFFSQLEITKKAVSRLREIQSERICYDGIGVWKQ